MIHATYISAHGKAVIAAHAAVLKAQREARRTERLQARMFPAACQAFKLLGWDDQSASELAAIHVKGAQ